MFKIVPIKRGLIVCPFVASDYSFWWCRLEPPWHLFFSRPCEFSWVNLREEDGMEKKKQKLNAWYTYTELGSFRDLAANVPLCIRVSENVFFDVFG